MNAPLHPRSEPTTQAKTHALASLPIAWKGVPRADFITEYVSVGAMPGILQEQLNHDEQLERALSQCVLLSRQSGPRQADDHASLASALLAKILQRGRIPPPTLGIEREALRTHGLLDAVRDLEAEGTEMGWELRPGARPHANPESVLAALIDRAPFALDPAFGFEPGSDTALLDSDAEARFLEQWVPQALGPSVGHWFTPQAPLDRLLESSGADGSGARQIDFLFNHPGGLPLAIEVDGPEHDSTAQVDEARDESLRAIGIDVLRVTNEEVCSGRGVVLDRIRSRCEEALSKFKSASVDDQAALLVIDCAVAAKVQFAIARAIGFGWLTAGQEWEIDLAGVKSVAAAGVLDTLKLLAGFDVLYGGRSVPIRCTVRADEEFAVTWFRDADGEWCETNDAQAQGESVRIAVESMASPFHRTPHEKRPDFLIRPAYVPVVFETEPTSRFGRQAIVPSTYDDASAALKTFLRNVFRKCQFRPNQGEAIFNVLRGSDCVVLLPTGAGKSLIYQLAGLLMPGITLVVDPLVSLIEDQVKGLRIYGIDRAVPITGNLAAEERKRLLRLVGGGEYLFVLHAPEQLQSHQFREELRALAQNSLVNLAVIDEAHCISDWGHDFRPAYLNLADNLRRLKDTQDKPPPLLALTGTASRVVLRDMQANLDIGRHRSDVLIRPESFDRKELSFEILRTSPTRSPEAVLRGALKALPGRFGLPRTEFYRPSDRNTNSGIVFVQTVDTWVFGLMDTRKIVQSATDTQVAIYSGKTPKQLNLNRDSYERQKRQNAKEFKDNRVPVLVATRAFGMGIDKPNIRYTVHFGMPTSLENFYQEAGRAGRDQKPAWCLVVFSEYSPERSDELLNPDLNLETLRERFEDVNQDRLTGDDVTRALFFHLLWFSGAEQEIDDVKSILDEIGDLSTPRPVPLPLEKDDAPKRIREKTICRLLKLGVINDYEVDYGSHKFIVQVEAFNLARCKQCLLDYARAAQPAKSKMIARRLNAIGSGRPYDVVLALARILIEFAYDVIERSRRRMIQESILLARQARDDTEIRGRLLDYLQEGFGAERIGQLLEAVEIDLAAWRELVYKIQTPMDAGELRGFCIRALESEPDHPGLLLARGIAESMCPDHDERVSSQGIGASIRTGVVNYELAQKDVEAIIDALFDLALTRAPGFGLPLTWALLDLDRAGSDLAFASKKGSERAVELDDPRVRTAIAAHKIRGVVDELETVGRPWIERYEAPAVVKALTGA